MKAASILFATALVLAIGGCHLVGDSDPMTEPMEEPEEGRIDFSRTTSFDGDKLTVFVSDGEDGKLHLNTVRDAVETNEFRPRIPNHSGRSWVLRNTAHESTTQVYALVSWNNEDSTDYLAAGWWLHQGEDDPYPERVIFVDGPEIDPLMNPPDLPATGTARYLGRGSGIFGYAFGSDWEELEGGYTYDAYRGEMEVVADFDAGTLSGCLACTGDLVADRTHLEYRFEQIPEQYLPEVDAPLEDYEIHFAPVAYNVDGSFESAFDSAAASVRHPEREVTGAHGFWGGSLSAFDDEDGNPRLIAGFKDAGFEEEDGSRGFFWGVFTVLSETFGTE